MHPLEALSEAELSQLSRIADHLFTSRLMLAPGHRPNRLHAGFGVEFLDHREFVPGDPIRDIDWRATARSRNPKIRRYWDESAADWTLCLDASASMGLERKWPLAVQATAALAYLLIHLDHRVGILLFSDHVLQRLPLGRGQDHYARVLRLLKSIAPGTSGGGSDLLTCLRHIKPRTPVFVISDFLVEDGMRNALEKLRLHGDRLHALQIVAHDEHSTTGSAMRLEDVESGEQLSHRHTEAAKNAYDLALDAFSDSLSQDCRRLRIQFSRCTPERGWKEVLIDHFNLPPGGS